MSVLYNTGSEIKSLKFEEIPIQHSLYTFGNYFGRIIRIPFYCCTSADPQALKEIQAQEANLKKVNMCNYRMFVEMPGFVDVELISNDGMNSLL